MAFRYTPYLLVLLLSAMVAAFLGAYAWRRRSVPAARPVTALFVLICLWCVGNALEIASVTLQNKLFWANLEYIAFVGIPVVWLMIALQYTGHAGALRPWHVALLLVIPIITLVLVWSNPYHGLMRSNVYLETSGAFSVVGKTYGPWFWVHTAYSYALFLTAAGLLISSARGLSPAYRGQPLVLLASMVSPYVVNVVYVFVLSPQHMPDPTPVAFIIAGGILAWGLFHYRLFDLMPIAYRSVIAGISDGVVVLDFQCRVVDLNVAAQRILYSHGEALAGRPASEAFAPWPALAQLCTNTEVRAAELVITRNGSPRYYDMQAAILSEPRAGRIGRVIVLRDVTDRRLREEALRASEERFRVIFESAGLGISVYTGDGALIYANPAVQKILGYTEVELSRMAPADYADPDDAVRDQTLLQDLVAGRRDHYQMEKRYRRKDGTCATGLLTRTVVRDAAGRPIFVIGMLEDISERKQAESQREAALRELARQGERMQALTRRLVTAQEVERRTIARELHDEAGGSLTALMLGLGQLQGRADIPADAAERLGELMAMADGILESLHRLSMNLRPVSLDRLGLVPALSQYLATFEQRAEIAVHFDAVELGEGRLPSEIESAIYRVVQEALTNVVKHSQATEVSVLLSRRAADPGDMGTPGEQASQSEPEEAVWIVAIVEDNGTGFDPNEAARSGRLGLLGMQERAEMLGGRLAVESAAGSGTTVYLEIPCPNSCHEGAQE